MREKVADHRTTAVILHAHYSEMSFLLALVAGIALIWALLDRVVGLATAKTMFLSVLLLRRRLFAIRRHCIIVATTIEMTI